jgi:hypothetical protein
MSAIEPIGTPYRPGNGIDPHTLAGRDNELKAFIDSLRGFGEWPVNFALYGLRGVGKTCLLRQYRKEAGTLNWVTIKREFSGPVTTESLFATMLLTDLQDALEELSAVESLKGKLKTLLEAAGDVVGSLSVKYQDFELSAAKGKTSKAPGILEDDFRRALEKVGAAAKERGRGVVLLYDEFQELRDARSAKQAPLSSLITAVASVQQDGYPVMLVASGLPPLIENLAEAKSYTERMFEGQPIDALPEAPARQAFEKPAEDNGRGYADQVVAAVLDRTAGYPYFLQHYGRHLWAASDEKSISMETFEAAAPKIRDSLDAYFYKSRYDRATAGEKAVLRAIAAHGEEATIQQLQATRGKKTSQSLQILIRGLVDKGVVYRSGRGAVAFSAPLFGDYVRRINNIPAPAAA